MRKLSTVLIAFLSIALCYPCAVKADIEILAPIQSKLGTVQLKVKEAQEKLMEYKKKLEDAATQATKLKDQAEGMKNGLTQAMSGDLSGLDKMPDKISVSIGKDEGAMKDTEKVSKAVEENIVPHTEGGETIEKDEEAKEFIQELMRDAVSALYAMGYTTIKKMEKEVPHDVDMTSKDQIISEIDMKAQECVERMAQIYNLESAQQTFQMIGEMQTVTYKTETEQKE